MNTIWRRLTAWLNRLVEVLDPPSPLEMMETRVRQLEAQLAAAKAEQR
ncbi:MAG: hypothetical protein WCO11_12485 [Sphingomonadales bacterium]